MAAPVHRPKKQPGENVVDQQKHSANTRSVRNYNTVIKGILSVSLPVEESDAEPASESDTGAPVSA